MKREVEELERNVARLRLAAAELVAGAKVAIGVTFFAVALALLVSALRGGAA